MISQEYQKKRSVPARKSTVKIDPIRVVTVDDSALIRLTLSRYLNRWPDIEVVGQAGNGQEMLNLIDGATPDVVVLDVEMPVMDGIQALERLMKTRPTPVIMLSNLTWSGAEVTLQALELGAVDFIVKPQPGVTMAETVDLLVQKIRHATMAQVHHSHRLESPAPPGNGLHRDRVAAKNLQPIQAQDTILAVASSTGGPSAVTAFLSALPPGLPVAGVIVQHMPTGFTAILSQRLNRIGNYKVVEAVNGSRLMQGQFLVAPGGYHLLFDHKGVAILNEDPTVNGVRPAADVTYHSLAQHFASQTIAVVLTGMGSDGFAGAAEIRRRGGQVVAQDERSSVVFGMPKRVIEANLADYIAPPQVLGELLANEVRRR